MKIYFEDGELGCTNQLPVSCCVIVHAGSGVGTNIRVLDDIMNYDPNATVYTNSILAFSNQYAWNEELQAPEVYIRAGVKREFTRIDKLTEREIRRAHNLAKMYLAGTFDE